MISISYKPYVGLLFEDKHVHTKMRNDGKLHFFQIGDNVFYDDFQQKDVDEMIAGKHGDITYLGWTELNNV